MRFFFISHRALILLGIPLFLSFPALASPPLIPIHVGPPKKETLSIWVNWNLASEHCAEIQKETHKVLEEDFHFLGTLQLSKKEESGKKIQIHLSCKRQFFSKNRHLKATITHESSDFAFRGSVDGTDADIRHFSHRIANKIAHHLLGIVPPFPSRFTFVCDKTGHKELYLADFDGKNGSRLTYHQSIALSPAWDPSGKAIAYTLFRKRRKGNVNPDLMIVDLNTKKSEPLSSRPGLNSGAAFSPDGKQIAAMLSLQGDPDIYLLSREGEISTKLTDSSGADISPHFSPDGKQIVYSSSKSGRPMIYIRNLENAVDQRLTFSGVYNVSPVWNPLNQQILFAGQLDRFFDLFLIDLKEETLTRLTSHRNVGDNEDPTWSPGGTHIAFRSTDGKESYIAVIQSDGTGKRRITFDLGNCSEPAWSPF